MKWTTAMKCPFCGIFWVTEIFQNRMETWKSELPETLMSVSESQSDLDASFESDGLPIWKVLSQILKSANIFSGKKVLFYFLNNEAVALWHHKLDSVVYFWRNLGNSAVVNHARRAEGEIGVELVWLCLLFQNAWQHETNHFEIRLFIRQ